MNCLTGAIKGTYASSMSNKRNVVGVKACNHLIGLPGTQSLWERAKFSLAKQSKLNNGKEVADVRNFCKDQL